MLENNNLKVCHRLVWRDLKFNKLKNILLLISIALICAMCTFSFAMGALMQDSLAYDCDLNFGSDSNILFSGLTREQADRISGHSTVKNTVRLSPIGILSGDEMEYRSVHLASATSDWAESVEAMPTEGRMPEEDDEIALDKMTLDSMGIPYRVGAEVTISWESMGGSSEYTNTFRLCGWWESAMNYRKTYAWITPNAAQMLGGDLENEVLLGVNLHQPKDLETQGMSLIQDIGLQNLNFTTNLSYNKERMHDADQRAVPYFIVNIFVVFSGIFIIYHILNISIDQNMRFYERLKSLGMTPRQIRCLSVLQCFMLCVAAVPVGWLLGFGLLMQIVSITFVDFGDVNAALLFFRIWPFVAGALVTVAAAAGSCYFTMRTIAKMSPAELAIRISSKKEPIRRRKRSNHVQLKGMFRMALNGVGRWKNDILLSAVSLFAALVLLCATWTEYCSFDKDIYLEELTAGDYLLADGSAFNSYQRYNPNSRSITSDMVKLIKNHSAVIESGILKTMEVFMWADEKDRAPIVETFERRDESGMARKEYMDGNPDWMDGYQRLKETGNYIGIITGIDGAVLEDVFYESPANDGAYDAKKFASGNYVVASGSDSKGVLTTPRAGSCVKICGREFTILASVPAYLSHTTGSDSREAEFNVSYYLPMKVFDELFVDKGIRNMLINIDHKGQEEFELFLTGLLEETNVNVKSQSGYEKNFQSERVNHVLAGFLVGCVLLIIGIVNFINSLIARMLVRKKEFAVYESLGMTKQMQKKLILSEGLLQGAILVVILLPCVSIVAWCWSRWWVEYINIWCMTYRFVLFPLWLTLPVLFILSAAVPLFSLRVLIRESVTERLRIID